MNIPENQHPSETAGKADLKPVYQLGLDTGGTYTDAVLTDQHHCICATAKSLTTHGNLLDGLDRAVQQVLHQTDSAAVELVSLSTTLATNALVEGHGRSVALLLIGYKEDQLERAGLATAMRGEPCLLVDGGHTATGEVAAELDTTACLNFVRSVDHKVDAYAVSAVFGVRNPTHERQVQSLIKSISCKPVSCAHHLSSELDAPRRALTAVLNARLIPMIRELIDATEAMLKKHSIDASLMIVKGDGSLVSREFAGLYPVETILSGPAASVVGARYLFDQEDMLIMDMGGTTTDIALVQDGQPQLSTSGATVAGWRTMVRALDVQSVGLGGDSAVEFETAQAQFTFGPNRLMPLCILASQYPQILDHLREQHQRAFSTAHSARFVFRLRDQGRGLTLLQTDLFNRISREPIALQTLFEEQSQLRTLLRLEQMGLVQRAGFTPTDASHILGRERTGRVQAARLGAKLIMRYSADYRGPVFSSEHDFAGFVSEQISRRLALAMTSAASDRADGYELNASQLELIERGFGESGLRSGQSLLSERHVGALVTPRVTLQMPVAALGAPSPSYCPQAVRLLESRMLTHQHAGVANALGAVVGVVRQQASIDILPAGGKRVRVLMPDGSKEFEELEAAADAASEHCQQMASDKARRAGADQAELTCERSDNIVQDGKDQVFLGSRIVATAIGRPRVSGVESEPDH